MTRLMHNPRTRNKFGAKKKQINGITFDSIAESEYYLLLLSRKQAGEIADIILQPRYELQARCILPDRKTVIAPIDYTADFEIRYPDGHIEAVDVKGAKVTEAASVRMRMFQARYPEIRLVIARKSRGGWTET